MIATTSPYYEELSKVVEKAGLKSNSFIAALENDPAANAPVRAKANFVQTHGQFNFFCEVQNGKTFGARFTPHEPLTEGDTDGTIIAILPLDEVYSQTIGCHWINSVNSTNHNHFQAAFYREDREIVAIFDGKNIFKEIRIGNIRGKWN